METIMNFKFDCIGLENLKITIQEIFDNLKNNHPILLIVLIIVIIMIMNTIFLTICSKVNDHKKKLDNEESKKTD